MSSAGGPDTTALDAFIAEVITVAEASQIDQEQNTTRQPTLPVGVGAGEGVGLSPAPGTIDDDAWFWDPLEWEDLRRSRRFSALARLALRGTSALRLETLAWHDPDLREDPNARALIDWVYKGRSKPKNTLSLRQQMRRGYRRKRGGA